MEGPACAAAKQAFFSCLCTGQGVHDANRCRLNQGAEQNNRAWEPSCGWCGQVCARGLPPFFLDEGTTSMCCCINEGGAPSLDTIPPSASSEHRDQRAVISAGSTPKSPCLRGESSNTGEFRGSQTRSVPFVREEKAAARLSRAHASGYKTLPPSCYCNDPIV